MQAYKQAISVILFGEAGVGKSTVLNLIARRAVAKVSSDVVGCAMESTRYDISFDDMNFSIFDTIGLNQPVFGLHSHLAAIESACKLILELKAAGGIHLLLCCMRRSGMSLTIRNDYRLFSEFLCQAKVPIALVFTGLEGEVEMEDWWTRNRADIASYWIKNDGHACITTITDGTLDEHLKYSESQQKIRELLKSCSLKTDAFLLDAMFWLAMTGTGMRRFAKKGSNPKRRDIEKVLSRHLGLPPDSVKRIIDTMEQGDAQPSGRDGEGRLQKAPLARIEDRVGEADPPKSDTTMKSRDLEVMEKGDESGKLGDEVRKRAMIAGNVESLNVERVAKRRQDRDGTFNPTFPKILLAMLQNPMISRSHRAAVERQFEYDREVD